MTSVAESSPHDPWKRTRMFRNRFGHFGEAAMFTAQLAGPNRIPAGMNDPRAPQNPQFLLNVLHWLSGRL